MRSPSAPLPTSSWKTAVVAALAIGLAAASAACKPTAPVGYFCRGGVKDDPTSRMNQQVPLAGPCLYFEPGSNVATWTQNGARYVVARAEKSFTLSQDGKVVARMTRDGSWLEVVFDETPAGADRPSVSLRSDMPGLMQ